MGTCCATLTEPKVISLVSYPAKQPVSIQKRDFAGRAAGCEVVSISLTRPSAVPALANVQTDSESWKVTSCVLPGLDPRGTIAKECQDAVFWTQCGGAILATVFDGHGFTGGAVANFCTRFVDSYFKEHYSEFPVTSTQENPSTSIKQMLELCDADLATSGIDVTMSGSYFPRSTAVVVYIHNRELYVGSLGDSRALLGSIRTDYGCVQYEAVQISVDQKPNHQQELERIVKMGGIVGRLENDLGEKVGPFRVWTRDRQAGLAMSRSLGDSIVHSVGVTATPIVRNFTLSPRRDRFLVLASDGIW